MLKSSANFFINAIFFTFEWSKLHDALAYQQQNKIQKNTAQIALNILN